MTIYLKKDKFSIYNIHNLPFKLLTISVKNIKTIPFKNFFQHKKID